MSRRDRPRTQRVRQRHVLIWAYWGLRWRKAGSADSQASRMLGNCRFHPFCRALISLNLDSARSNLSLNSHIASRISRKVADVLALSTCPKVKMLLLRRYPSIVGSEILYLARLPDLRADLVGLGIIWMSSKSFI